jgi:transcriptional regulator with XRE-family HTH domain
MCKKKTFRDIGQEATSMVAKPVATGLSIGDKLKALRIGQGKTVEELAMDTQMDPVLISQIEKGVTTPPVGTLIKLASAFNVHVGHFFEEEHAPHKVEVVRSSERKRIQRVLSHRPSPLSYAYQSLAYRKSDRMMEPFLLEFDIHIDEEIPPLEHEGEEFIFLLEGELEVHMGKEVIHLYEGDSIYFDSDVPHAFIGRGHKKPKAIAVLYAHRR